MLKLYNTLKKKEQNFKPAKKEFVSLYSCGPTVYNYAHIGNFRTYTFNDLLKRSLEFLGYKVKHVMNITDVDDKTIKGSVKENLSLKDFTRKYEKIFLEDLESLNIIKPNFILRATENIPEMVKIIEGLLKKKYAYKTSDGIYFSIDKSKKYGELANLEKSKHTEARIKSDEYDKSNAQDFALWKFYTPEDGQVFWETSLGKGRPGWHIECSAMSMKILGNPIDIHTGAIDLIFPHHTNEIAQSEAFAGKKFVNYWLHGGFLTMKEAKMSKSLGNIFTLKELKQNAFQPIHYRYLCLLTHYRKPLDFSLDNLDAAKTAFERLKRKVIEIKKQEHKGKDFSEKYEKEFIKSLENDLNIPQAVQVVWKALDDFDFDPKIKLKLLEKFDTVLGLGISEFKEEKVEAPSEVIKLLSERESLRKAKKYAESDVVRQRIKDKGYIIQDTPEGPKLVKI